MKYFIIITINICLFKVNYNNGSINYINIYSINLKYSKRNNLIKKYIFHLFQIIIIN